jgi:hypothetical protein
LAQAFSDVARKQAELEKLLPELARQASPTAANVTDKPTAKPAAQQPAASEPARRSKKKIDPELIKALQELKEKEEAAKKGADKEEPRKQARLRKTNEATKREKEEDRKDRRIQTESDLESSRQAALNTGKKRKKGGQYGSRWDDWESQEIKSIDDLISASKEARESIFEYMSKVSLQEQESLQGYLVKMLVALGLAEKIKPAEADENREKQGSSSKGSKGSRKPSKDKGKGGEKTSPQPEADYREPRGASASKNKRQEKFQELMALKAVQKKKDPPESK